MKLTETDRAALGALMEGVGQALHDDSFDSGVALQALEAIAGRLGVPGPGAVCERLCDAAPDAADRANELREIEERIAERDAELDAAAGTRAGYLPVELVELLTGDLEWMPTGHPGDPLAATPAGAEQAGLRSMRRPRAVTRGVAELTVLGSQTTVRRTAVDEPGDAAFYLAITKTRTRGYVLNHLDTADSAWEAAGGHLIHSDPDAAFGVAAVRILSDPPTTA